MSLSSAEKARRWRETHLDRVREQNKMHAKAYRQKVKLKMLQGSRYCRICQAPEQEEEFTDIFDKSHNIALELYLLSSVVVSS